MAFKLDVQNTSLAADFGIVPFTLLDARQGAWRNRKKAWLSTGLRGDKGREHDTYFVHDTLQHPKYGRYIESVASVFDPVLCELMYSWFCPIDGYIFDPFAGGSTRGIVAETMGYGYMGVEVREKQVEANYKDAERMEVEPTWVHGDSVDISKLRLGENYDMIFTCPPYYNLEAYHGGDKDLSEKQSYTEFITWYWEVFSQVVQMLRDDRFLCVVVGEVREKGEGHYVNFVGDTISMFMKLGLRYYNKFVYVTPVGTMGIRTRRQFPCSRKAGKVDQTVLCFWKGDTKKVRDFVHLYRKLPFAIPMKAKQ